jgi:uncharacterized membrane protein YphA (DoxX/SURF4 family)
MLSPIVDSWQRTILRLRQRRWANVFVVLLRIFIGFAFVPAGLKKLLGSALPPPARSWRFRFSRRSWPSAGARPSTPRRSS